jgi:ferredoxin-NADP reductase
MPERGAQPNVSSVRRGMLRAARALSSPLEGDDYIEMIDPLWTTRELRGRIESIERETADAVTVTIRPGHDWPGHEAGQFVRIGFDIDGVRHWRAYSLASDPDHVDGCISITVKTVDDGVVSPFLAQRAEPGTIVTVSDVEGEYVLPDPLPAKLLFISGGSGVTPIMSMLRQLEREDALDDVVHVHSAKTRTTSSSGASCATWRSATSACAARAAHARAGPRGSRRPRRALSRLARA